MRLSVSPPVDRSAYPFVHTVRPRFAETDAMGIIHHAAYLPYLEEARVEWLRAAGRPYLEVRANGIDLVVLEIFVQYRRPLRFDESVAVRLAAGQVTRTTFQIAYLLEVEGVTRATATSVHGAVDPSGRATRLPDWVGGVAVDW